MRITLKRVLLFAGLACLLLVAYVAYQLLTPSGPITISPQTTVITKPLADDGLPDYAAYLLGEMQQGVTPENNGAIPFLQAMWPADIDPTVRKLLCDELGMEVPASPGMDEPYGDAQLLDNLVRQYREQLDGNPDVDNAALRRWVQDELLGYFGSTPWREAQAPALADWLRDNRENYELLHEAARRKEYYLPPTNLLSTPKGSLTMVLLPHVQTLRSATRCLSLRANHYLGSDDLAAAWQDCLAMYRLSETSSQQALVGELVSIACESLAHRTAIGILNAEELPLKLARQMHTFYASRGPRDNMRPTIDGFERLAFVTAVLEMSGERPPADPNSGMPNQLGPLAVLAHLAIDWNLMLEIGNQWYDQLVDAMSLPTHAERRAAIAAVESRLAQRQQITTTTVIGSVVSRNARTKNMANILSSLLLPAVNAAIEAENRANVLRQSQRIATALAVHRLQNGDYPASLDALVPALLDEPPVDLYGNRWVYQPTAGGYLLYSQGANGVDDLGSNHTLSLYKGYETGDTEEQDRALRKLLGEPPADTEDSPDYQRLAIPDSADDLSLRLPLYRDPLPEFEAVAE